MLGLENPRFNRATLSLAAAKSEVMKDRVATTRLYRYWAVPGLTDPDAGPLTCHP